MKTKILRKLVALGMGATMVGATIFGASAAKLSDYPAPFIMNGVPASNLAVIVGDNAAPSDVVGMGDIIQGLQASAVVKSAGTVAGPRVQLLGDSVEIGTPTDLLELNETIGDVRETLTEFDLSILKGGSISTRRGVTKYNQYIKFNKSDVRSNSVQFGEDEFDNVGHFFHIVDSDYIFDWVLEFEEGFKSDNGAVGDANTTNTQFNLRDLQDREINILGTTYTIVGTLLDTASTTLRLEFLGGPIYDALGEGDKKTYTLNGKEYEVEVVVISESAASGAGEVLLKVNGETLPRLRATETEPTADGTLFGIRDIIPTGKDTQSSVVRFYLGASKIVMKDTNYGDDIFVSAGATINNELIEDSQVKMKATVGTDSTTTVQSITYRLQSNALVGDMFVPPGHGIREYLNEPAGLLAPSWDIRYEGLIDTGVTTIKFNPIGRDEYKLEFTNQEGLNYVIPFITARDTAVTSLRYGDYTSGNHRNLVWFEGSDPGVYQIRLQDYFILSDVDGSGTIDPYGGAAGLPTSGSGRPFVNATYGNTSKIAYPTFTASQTDNTAFTRVLKYESIDTTNSVLTFTDLATGTKQVSYDSGNNAQLIVGGITYIVNVTASPTSTAANLSIDLNGDSFRYNGTAVIATEGGALLLLGAANNTGTSVFGDVAVEGVNVTINTLSKQFDESGTNVFSDIPFEYRTGNNLGITRNGIVGTSGFGIQAGDLKFLTSEPEIAQALDKYGVFYELFDPLTTNTPEELTIEYPLSQRGVQVFVTAGTVTAQTVGGSAGAGTGTVQALPVGTSKLASEVSDVSMYNAIVVGGPCANAVAAKLMGNPETCWEAVPENKAIIKLYEQANGNVALLVAGRTAMNTRQGARALLTNGIAGIAGMDASVSGTTITDVQVTAVA